MRWSTARSGAEVVERGVCQNRNSRGRRVTERERGGGGGGDGRVETEIREGGERNNRTERGEEKEEEEGGRQGAKKNNTRTRSIRALRLMRGIHVRTTFCQAKPPAPSWPTWSPAKGSSCPSMKESDTWGAIRAKASPTASWPSGPQRCRIALMLEKHCAGALASFCIT